VGRGIGVSFNARFLEGKWQYLRAIALIS